jgi:quercetin dioxygenase-like cupin family protein
VGGAPKAENEPRGEEATVSEEKRVRLVVTGHDADVSGQVIRDELVGPSEGLAADGWQAYMLWGVDELPTYPDAGVADYGQIMPGPGGVRLVQLVVHPEGSDTARSEGPAVADAGIERSAGHGSAMHHTPTFDCIVVLDGEVVLDLDNGSTTLRKGDFLVQSGTRHAWRNRTDSPARLGVFVVGTPHAGFTEP